MWQKSKKISPIFLNAIALAVAGAALIVQEPQISLKAQTTADYSQVKSVKADASWDSLFSRVLSAKSEKQEVPVKGTTTPVPTPTPEPVVAYEVESITATKPLPTATSTPTPVALIVPSEPTVAVVNESVNVEMVVRQFASEYGVDGEIMVAIARCESGLRARAVNGPYGGIFQFLASTWSSNRNAMGMDPDPGLRFNPTEAARTAAFKMARDGFGAWPSCSKKALSQKI